MSTRAIIALGAINSDGTTSYINPATTIHYDGHPANILPTLMKYFDDPYKSYELCDNAPFLELKTSGEIRRDSGGPFLYSGRDDFKSLEETAEYFFDTEYAYLYDKSWNTFKIIREKDGEDWKARLEKIEGTPKEIAAAEMQRIIDCYSDNSYHSEKMREHYQNLMAEL